MTHTELRTGFDSLCVYVRARVHVRVRVRVRVHVVVATTSHGREERGCSRC